MKITPRPDQRQFIDEIHQAWHGGARNVVAVASTGFGKTVCLADIVERHDGWSCVIAHRQELVSQVSMMLARYGISHNIIAAESTRRAIAAAHVAEFGVCYYAPSAFCTVASVDTLVRAKGLESWAARVTLWIVDEGHHLVLDNKWHRAISMFTHPACRGLLPTATPARADGKGLGRPELGGSGVADVIVQAPPLRWLIDNGHLCRYRVICVESDLRRLIEQEKVSANGDWSSAAGRKASEKSKIVGDVVASYRQYCPGNRHIVFCTDTKTAADMTAAFRADRWVAECLTGETADHVRRDILRRFERGQVHVICAVDIISEGFDLPAIESCSFARPSQSLPTVWQQFGRTLRIMAGKTLATIIDHVGNVINPAIGLPDRRIVWTLRDRDKRGSGPSDAIPYRVCVMCAQPYERIYRECVHCGHYPEPAGRSSPAMVDGAMAEMSEDLAARLRGDIEQATLSIPEERARLAQTGLPHVQTMANVKRHAERLEALAELRDTMGLWGGARLAEGLTDDQMQRLFWHRFGISVPEALALKRAEAVALRERIGEWV